MRGLGSSQGLSSRLGLGLGLWFGLGLVRLLEAGRLACTAAEGRVLERGIEGAAERRLLRLHRGGALQHAEQRA